MSVLDLDSLLDQSMNDVKEAPNFIEPENSTLILSVVKFDVEIKETSAKKKEEAAKEGKAVADKYAQISAQYKILEVVEQDAGTPPMKVESLFGETWLAEGKGLEFFKTRACDIAESQGVDREEFGNSSLRQQIAALNGGGIDFKANIKKVKRANSEFFNVRIENIRAASAE